MKILILDVTAVFAKILQHALMTDKIHVDYSLSPKIAMQKTQQDRYDYVCVSLTLEGIDGIQFSAQLRKNANYRSTPIILLAAKDNAVLTKAIIAGVTDVFDQEDDIDALVAHIQRNNLRTQRLNGRVLYVADSVSEPQTLTKFLTDAGLQVTVFKAADTAFESFLAQDYDLVITDILLAGDISGLRLVNWIRRLTCDKGDVPILAITAFDDLAQQLDTFSHGVNDYVKKPVIQEELIARVTNLLNNNSEKATVHELKVKACAFETHEAIVIADEDARILRVNTAFTDITGFQEGDVLGNNLWRICTSEISNPDYDEAIIELSQTDEWTCEVISKYKDGECFDAWLTVSLIRCDNHEIRNYVAVFMDITEKKKREREIHHQASFDPLTDLPNRRMFLEKLENTLLRASQYGYFGALLFLDLDKLKAINETLGHPIGDLLLIEIGKRLQGQIRQEDVLSRMGYDAFVVLLPQIANNEDEAQRLAKEVAHKLRYVLTHPFQVGGKTLYTSASVGIAIFPSAQDDIHDILRHADIAMFQAKSDTHKAVHFFSHRMQQQADERLALENDLHCAVERGELLLNYQPQMDQNGVLIGAEVLLRWHRNHATMVPPAIFIAIAEQSGLIESIGEWVFKAAATQLKHWLDAELIAPRFRLAINVSPVQFLMEHMAQQVLDIFLNAGVPTENIELECTESLFINNMAMAVKVMQVLRKAEIQFSIDDFGMGYTSLNYLKQLPIYKLKIDQSFVGDIAVDKNGAAIVETIIMMAHNLGLEVIAEGVETAHQLAFLKHKGCCSYQGYYFSKPLTAGQFSHQFLPPNLHS